MLSDLGLYAMIENWTKEFIIQRLLAITLLVVLFILCFQVVQFFIVPALWAAILAYVTFPVYKFFHEKVRLSPDLSSAIMTISISLIIGVPLVIGVFILQQEALSLISNIIYRIKVGYLDVPDSIKDLPIIGQQIKETLWQINKNREGTLGIFGAWVQSHIYYG